MATPFSLHSASVVALLPTSSAGLSHLAFSLSDDTDYLIKIISVIIATKGFFSNEAIVTRSGKWDIDISLGPPPPQLANAYQRPPWGRGNLLIH